MAETEVTITALYDPDDEPDLEALRLHLVDEGFYNVEIDIDEGEEVDAAPIVRQRKPKRANNG